VAVLGMGPVFFCGPIVGNQTMDFWDILGTKKILKPESYDLCIYVIGFMI
jgi:hypothetical protein